MEFIIEDKYLYQRINELENEINLLADQLNGMTNQLDRVEDENKRLREALERIATGDCINPAFVARKAIEQAGGGE